MNYLLEVCLVTLTLATSIAPSVAAQSPVAAPENSSFAGTWERRMNDLLTRCARRCSGRFKTSSCSTVALTNHSICTSLSVRSATATVLFRGD